MSEDAAATTAPHERMVMLPCPFCGGEAERHHHWSPTQGTFHSISCKRCHATTGGDAEKHWNRRSDDICGECRHERADHAAATQGRANHFCEHPGCDCGEFIAT